MDNRLSSSNATPAQGTIRAIVSHQELGLAVRSDFDRRQRQVDRDRGRDQRERDGQQEQELDRILAAAAKETVKKK